MLSLEIFEQSGLDTLKPDLEEKVKTLNASFFTNLTAENGIFGRIDGISQIIKEQTGWSDEIVDAIRSSEEFKIYKDANLVEGEVGGRKCLLKTDIDWAQTDEFGRTNSERIQNGNNPIAKDGQTIELHHIGQKKDSPLAELTTQEHRGTGNYKDLHDLSKPTEVYGEDNNWSSERKGYLMARQEAKITQKSAFSRAFGVAHEAGVKSGLTAAGITAAISTVDNVRGVINGEISPQEVFVDVAKDTGAAAAIGYGSGFISAAVANAMSQSGHNLIRTLGGAGVPAATIAFGIDSYDSVVNYAKGEMSASELAYDLGESAAGIAGSMAGATLSGAALGTVVGPIGTVAGGLVGGMIGYAVATGTYATVIEATVGGVDVLADKADSLKGKAMEMGQGVIDLVTNTAPEAVDHVKSAINDYASNLGLSFHL